MVEVNSPDDPYGCDDKQGGPCSTGSAPRSCAMTATSATTTSPYDTFPLLDRLID
jgi:hypothetical protein